MKKIVGYEKEMQEIAVIRDMLHNAGRYREKGVRIPRGLLLIGAPGVGKTEMARSIPDSGINLVELHAATCCDSEAVSAVKQIFVKAKSAAPAVLLLDELDKIAGGSPHFYMNDNDKVKKTLLQELDALGPQDEILVVATCNNEKCLGSELIRPGRFDRQIRVPTPDEETRKQILRAYFGKIKARKRVDLDLLARNTGGFTCAKLECLANDAGILALQKDSPVITEDDVRTVLNKLEFGATEKDPFSDPLSLHRVAVHEAGHALAALLLSPDNLFGASVMPQGDSNGHIRFVPSEDSVRTVSEIEAEAAVMLAGHVAERVHLGEYLTGSGSDLEDAVLRIHYLCTREGAYGYESVLAGVLRGGADLESVEIKNRIGKVVEEKLNELDRKTERLIREHSGIFSAICSTLEEKRILTRDELLSIMESTSAAA